MALEKYNDKYLANSSLIFANRDNDMNMDTFAVMEQEGITLFKSYLIPPDSMGVFDTTCLFNDKDSASLYIIKKEIIDSHTWNEIRNKKLYDRFIVTKEELNYETPFRLQRPLWYDLIANK